MHEFSWLVAYSASSDSRGGGGAGWGWVCKGCTLFGDEVKHETNTNIKILFSETLTAKKNILKGFWKITLHQQHYIKRQWKIIMQWWCRLLVRVCLLRKIFKLPHPRTGVRAAIAPIVGIVIVLGHQRLSFPGHKDDSKYHSEPGGYAKESVGNFVEFLQFCAKGGDKCLKKHLEKSAKMLHISLKNLKVILLNMQGKQYLIE